MDLDWGGSDPGTDQLLLEAVEAATAMPPPAATAMPPPSPPPQAAATKVTKRTYIRKPGRPKRPKVDHCCRCDFVAQLFSKGIKPGFIEAEFNAYAVDRNEYNKDCNRCLRLFFEL